MEERLLYVYVDDERDPLREYRSSTFTVIPQEQRPNARIGEIKVYDRVAEKPVIMDLIYFKTTAAAKAWIEAGNVPTVLDLDYVMTTNWDGIADNKTTLPVLTELAKQADNMYAQEKEITVLCHSGAFGYRDTVLKLARELLVKKFKLVHRYSPPSEY